METPLEMVGKTLGSGGVWLAAHWGLRALPEPPPLREPGPCAVSERSHRMIYLNNSEHKLESALYQFFRSM
jgi:hypothetical protein